LDKNEQIIYAVNAEKNLRVWDLSDGIDKKSYRDPFPIKTFSTEHRSHPVNIHPHESYIAHEAENWNMIMREIPDLDKYTVLQGHNNIINEIAISSKDLIASASDDGSIKIWEANTGENILSLILSGNEHILVTGENFYKTTKGGYSFVAFNLDNKVYPFEQFDIQYNRPDIVIKITGLTDKITREMFHQAYLKRLKKMGFKEEDLSGEFHIPVSAIEDFEYMPVFEEDKLDLNLKFKDSRYKLDRYNIWVNDVPVFGIKGKSLKYLNTDSCSVTETVNLLEGRNKIQVSCHNIKGAESYKETIEITCQPEKPVRTDLYIIALSVSGYLDKSMNLRYAVKDGRDLTALLSKSKDFDNIYIDTLFDQDATKKNIISLKQKLLKSKVDDQVILFVSGHGLLDDNLDFYFATHDIDFDKPAERGISYDQLEWLLDSIPARKKLFMMDACHSGEVDKEELLAFNDLKEEKDLKKGLKSYTYRAKVLQAEENSGIGLHNSFELMQELFTNLNRGSGAVVISAAAGDSYALESDEWNNGVFTWSVLDGLKNNHADMDKNGEITVSELREYVSNKVQQETGGRQKPTARQENVEFDFRVW